MMNSRILVTYATRSGSTRWRSRSNWQIPGEERRRWMCCPYRKSRTCRLIGLW